jgi:hypothetical protein
MHFSTGDSRGKTSFWNGKNGTLMDSIQSHKADVLTGRIILFLEITGAGTRLCTAVLRIRIGDPVLFYPPDPGSRMEQWSDPDPGSEISKQNLLIAFIQK